MSAPSKKVSRLQVNGRKTRSLLRSRIARLIFASNLTGLVILVSGALFVNEVRAGLVQARTESLESQARGFESVVSQLATLGDPEPVLLPDVARSLLKRLQLPANTRIRLYDADRKVVADSFLLAEQVEMDELPPIRKPNIIERSIVGMSRSMGEVISWIVPRKNSFYEAETLDEELAIAMAGDIAASQRFSERGERLISVSVPIQRVSAVLGVLTVEASDVQDIVRAERAALTPIIVVAVLVALITSALLTIGIARPLRRLSIAADRVRAGTADKLDMPNLAGRKDEIGDLAQALDAMTTALKNRIELNERFAADVAHELKNPLTSIRSAVETAQAVDSPEVRERMRAVIAKDVVRLDRLITDISNASRLEAEIARETPTDMDLIRLLEDLVSIWKDTRKDDQPFVELVSHTDEDGIVIIGREGPISQVIRNLVENARSFSPANGKVTITAYREDGVARLLFEDEGPGIPPDKLDTIFDRFYSDRPKGATFGNNSGLGLSIVRQIVESHRGEVFAENRMRNGEIVGARFVVRLPLARRNVRNTP